jgi:hypothetical protein
MNGAGPCPTLPAGLIELSTKAKENGESYAVLTAARAAESVARQPYRGKPTPRP